MRLGIDARLYSQTGVGVYLRNLLHYLENIVGDKFEVFVYLLPSDYENVKFKNKYFSKRRVNHKWHTWSEQTGFALDLYQDRLDLMHFTYFGYPVIYNRKFIVTIHDATPLIFKTGKASTQNSLAYEIKYQAFKYVISSQVKKSQIIITPTRTVKNQLLQIYGKKYADKIKPIYEGVNFELFQSSKKFLISKSQYLNKFKFSNSNYHLKENDKFFIYIGNFYPHKNIEVLIKAFFQVKTNNKLILIGPDDYFAERLYKLVKELKQQERIVFYHNPSREDLVFFYNYAEALIHPSLSEGFGLPIIEAAYYGLPILASNIDVFNELLDGKYLKFDPNDANDIAAKIGMFLKNNKAANYKDLLKKYSFEQMAKATCEIYFQLLS